jgi:hypothetical protein
LVFSVNGSVAPETEKPVPVIVTALTITGRAPVEVRVTVCVVGVLRLTFPKAMLVALMSSVAKAAFNCSAKVLDTVPAIAESVAFCAVVTDEKVAVKLALAEPAATVTDDGTVTAVLLLERPTVKPPLAAAALSTTVHVSVPEPVTEEFVHESAVSTGTPVPLNATVVEPPEDELLTSVNCPLLVPARVGSNCMVSVVD